MTRYVLNWSMKLGILKKKLKQCQRSRRNLLTGTDRERAWLFRFSREKSFRQVMELPEDAQLLIYREIRKIVFRNYPQFARLSFYLLGKVVTWTQRYYELLY